MNSKKTYSFAPENFNMPDLQRSKVRPILFLSVFIVLTLVAITVVYFLMRPSVLPQYKELEPPDVETSPPPSASKLRIFDSAAVCSDASICAKIGKEILSQKNATVIDSMVATLFCNGIYGLQSSGIGGGFIMTYYNKEEGRAYVLNARETAPMKATKDMFLGQPNASRNGANASGVPGELAGYHAAWKRFGKLPWADLVQPSIDLCVNGFNLSSHTSVMISFDIQSIRNDPYLREMLIDPVTNDRKLPGTWVKPIPKLCDTLKLIALKGVDEFYNGTLGDDFALDMQEMGGIMTRDDLRNYRVKWTEPSQTKLYSGETFYTSPAPSSGDILVFIMNILNGYQINEDSFRTENSTLTLHRMMEAYKFAYARRTEIGDPDFVNIKDLLLNLTSQTFADSIRSKISDYTVQKDYGANVIKEDHGTAHISILSAAGDAVSVTSTVNLYFGARVVSKRTGIIPNSGMDDFSTPGFANFFNIPPSLNNLIQPGKRAVSSTCPTIVVDEKGDVKFVVGSSGGVKIISALAQIIVKYLWQKENLKQSIDDPRIFHQLYPNKIQYELGVPKQIIKDLYPYGHDTSRLPTLFNAVVCGLGKTPNGQIEGNADFRKVGDVFGF